MKTYEKAAVRCAQKRLRLFGKDKAVSYINVWADRWAQKGITVDKAAVMQAVFAPALLHIKVNYENGDSTVTRINATPDEARAYYVGKVFNVGLGPNDNLQRCTGIEIMEGDAE